MGGLNSYLEHLGTLQRQVALFTASRQAAMVRLKTEAEYLEREDAMERLVSLIRSIKASLLENLETEIQVSRENRFRSLRQSQSEPCGLVKVILGPQGIPQDLQVWSISRQARERHLTEAEIMRNLQKSGYLVLEREECFQLMFELIARVRDGHLQLPISQADITAIIRPGCSRRVEFQERKD